MVLSFALDSSLRIARQFTGLELPQFDENAADALGEIVNIIAGNAKEGLMDFRIYISLPKVIRGESLTLPREAPVIKVPFTFAGGSFNMIVALVEEDV